MKGVGLAVSYVLMPNVRRFAFAGNNAARLFPECFPIVLGSLFCPVVFCFRLFSRRFRLRPIFSVFRLFPTDWRFSGQSRSVFKIFSDVENSGST